MQNDKRLKVVACERGSTGRLMPLVRRQSSNRTGLNVYGGSIMGIAAQRDLPLRNGGSRSFSEAVNGYVNPATLAIDRGKTLRLCHPTMEGV